MTRQVQGVCSACGEVITLTEPYATLIAPRVGHAYAGNIYHVKCFKTVDIDATVARILEYVRE